MIANNSLNTLNISSYTVSFTRDLIAAQSVLVIAIVHFTPENARKRVRHLVKRIIIMIPYYFVRGGNLSGHTCLLLYSMAILWFKQKLSEKNLNYFAGNI